MSKMTMPTVDVVRFQESDVIVASGGVTPLSAPLIINGFVSEGPRDGSMTWGGHTYFYSENADLVSKIIEDGYGNQVQLDPSERVDDIGRMFGINQTNDWREVETTSGNYYWNPSASRWEYNYSGQ